MPRLTNQAYLQRHQQLRQLWLEAQRHYAQLPLDQQWLLHDYYQPSKPLTNDQLIVHRRSITKDRPSLPNAASKAYQRLLAAPLPPPRPLPPQPRPPTRPLHIRVSAVVRPEPDTHRLALVVMEVAKQMMRGWRHRIEEFLSPSPEPRLLRLAPIASDDAELSKIQAKTIESIIKRFDVGTAVSADEARVIQAMFRAVGLSWPAP